MPTGNIKDKTKIEWLRSAAKEGFDQLDRGEGIEFQSMDELGSYIDQIGEEVSKEMAAIWSGTFLRINSGFGSERALSASNIGHPKARLKF